MSNEDEGEMARQVGRLVFELRTAGYSTDALNGVIRKAEKQSWCRMHVARDAARLSEIGARLAAGLDDAVWEAGRLIARVSA